MYYRRNYGIAPRTIGGLMEDVLQNGWSRINEEVNAFKAPVNIRETETSYELHLVVPGLSKEDFKINIDKDLLNISYDRKEENKDEASAIKWLKSEFRLNSFKRTFSLNDKIDAEKISAKYADGILLVTLAKKEVSAPASHEIPVN
jgi:HSP20 family protein